MLSFRYTLKNEEGKYWMYNTTIEEIESEQDFLGTLKMRAIKEIGGEIIHIHRDRGIGFSAGCDGKMYQHDILESSNESYVRDGKVVYRATLEWDDDTGSFFIYKHCVSNAIAGSSHGNTYGVSPEDIQEFYIVGNEYNDPQLLSRID